jgi:hypothetical protein
MSLDNFINLEIYRSSFECVRNYKVHIQTCVYRMIMRVCI